MAGITALQKIQLGQEVTAGTEVDATTIWRGVGTLDDALDPVYVEENIGYISPVNRTYIPRFEGMLSMADTPATYQQLGYILAAGIDDATGAADGTGSDFVYTYTLDTTSQSQAIQTFTIEMGDNQQAELGLYGFVESFTLSGAGGEALMMSAEWRTRQINTGSFTGSVSVPAVEEVLFSKGKLYIDTTGGTFGTTTITDTLLAATVNVTTGIIPKWTADGSLDFEFIQYTRPEITVDVTFEHNASAVSAVSDWRSENAKLLRLIFEGSAFETAGTAYSVHTLIIDLAGSWQNFDALDDQDGNSIRSGTFRAGYDSTADDFGKVILVNELSALT